MAEFHLEAVKDLFNCVLMGYAICERMTADLVSQVLFHPQSVRYNSVI